MKIQHTLNVERREKLGSRYSKRYRAAGKLPAVLYGHGKAPVSLLLDAKNAVKFFGLGEKLFNISLESEGAEQAVFLKDVQFDYLGTNIVHVDLTRVDIGEEIQTNVPIEFYNEPKSMEDGDVLQTQMDAAPVKCAIKDLPDLLRVDLSRISPGNPFTAGMLMLGDNVELDTDPGDIVVTIASVRQSETEIEGEAETIGAEGAEPELIGEKDEEGAEGQENTKDED
jgi:large subunit ribosomal protein L25